MINLNIPESNSEIIGGNWNLNIIILKENGDTSLLVSKPLDIQGKESTSLLLPIEKKDSTKLFYELALSLGASLIFGYIFGDIFEKKIKEKVHKYLIIAVAFLILFAIFYTLNRLI